MKSRYFIDYIIFSRLKHTRKSNHFEQSQVKIFVDRTTSAHSHRKSTYYFGRALQTDVQITQYRSPKSTKSPLLNLCKNFKAADYLP